MSSGGKESLTLAAQAARRRRAQRTSPPQQQIGAAGAHYLQNTASSSVPQSAARVQPHHTMTPSHSGADSLLDRSMEVGEEVQSLLASVRKTVKGRPQTMRQPPEQQQNPPLSLQRDQQPLVRSAQKIMSSESTSVRSQAREYPSMQQQTDIPAVARGVPSRAEPSADGQQTNPDASTSSARFVPSQTPPRSVPSSSQHQQQPNPAVSVGRDLPSPTPAQRRQANHLAASDVREVNSAAAVSKNKIDLPLQTPLPKSAMKKANGQRQSTQQQRQQQSLTFQLPKQQNADVIAYDAACFANQALVMLRSHATAAKTVSMVNNKNTGSGDKWWAASVDGKCLGQSREILRLSIFQQQQQQQKDRPLSYGDRVTLICQNDKFLEVRRRATTDENSPLKSHTTFAIGFSSQQRLGNKGGQQWTVLNATTVVRVGRAALEEEEEDGKSKLVSKNKEKQRPVRVGDLVALRNCQTGGVLSSYRDGNLKLVTDAYSQPVVADPDIDEDVVNPDGDPSLMTRLHRHDRLVPSLSETFSFCQSTNPGMPLWMAAELCYLDGSYLWQTHCQKSTRELERLDAALFGESKSDEGCADHVDRIWTDYCKQMQSAKGQEIVLIDELIGASLGLEGEYIKVALTDGGTWGLHFKLANGEFHQFDVILRSIVEEMLPLPTGFARVRRFVAQHTPGYEYGGVMQAFCGSLDRLLRARISEVMSWQNDFRADDLTIRKLQVKARSAMHAVSLMEQACMAAQDKKGGALINALKKLKLQSHDGDGPADRLLQELLNTSAEPYMTRLAVWLDSGVLLEDPHGEFMIRRAASTAWENKYEVSTENVLEGFFSTKLTVERVLAAGRYWNAVRASNNMTAVGKEEVAPLGDLSYEASTTVVSSYVQTQYSKASTALVKLLLEKDEYDLMGSLRLTKRFFLLESGDFFVNFLDKAEAELLKDVSYLSRNRIQHWMNSLLQLSQEDLVPGCDHLRKKVAPTGLRCRFSTEGLADHLDKLHAASGGIDTHETWTPMRHAYGGSVGNNEGEFTGLDTFFLEFAAVPFPISLVISQGAMECYQLMFRHLFFAKYVERRLVSIWQDHQAMKELQALRGLLGPTFLLRQRMLHFLQNLIYYMMFEVIEPNWLEMETAVSSPSPRKEQTVDDILREHSQFLHRILEACLLTNRDVVRALTKLMKTCILFTEQMKRFMKATKIEDERNSVAIEMQKKIRSNLNERGGSENSTVVSSKLLKESIERTRSERFKRVQRQTARVQREVSGASYQRMVNRFEEVFSDNLREFMVQLTSSDDLFHSHKVNLCVRLDYNGFVTSSLGLT